MTERKRFHVKANYFIPGFNLIDEESSDRYHEVICYDFTREGLEREAEYLNSIAEERLKEDEDWDPRLEMAPKAL